MSKPNRILAGAFTSNQEYKKLLRYRIQFIHEFLHKAFEKVDILIAPVWPCYIPTIKESDLGANSDAANLVRRIAQYKTYKLFGFACSKYSDRL